MIFIFLYVYKIIAGLVKTHVKFENKVVFYFRHAFGKFNMQRRENRCSFNLSFVMSNLVGQVIIELV